MVQAIAARSATERGQDAPVELAARVESDWVRELMEWHFNPDTGSPFWLAKAASLDFDPRGDVQCVADLVRFPDVSSDLRDVRVEQLVPKGIREGTPRVFESGGTTGRPKRIVDFTAWDEEAMATNTALDEHAFPAQGNWLYVGPTGPHVMAYIVARVARLRAGAVLSLDFDPRWVKQALRAGQHSVAEAYVAHILEQAHDILQDQQIATAVFTPPILVAAARRTRLVRLLDRVSAIMWAGTSISPETLRLLEADIFPGIKFAGQYGNTVMGATVQRPRADDDPARCVFRSLCPRAHVDVVDFADPTRLVAYGARGRVRVHRLTRDMFLPNMLERDSAIRVARVDGDDDLADVRPCSPDELSSADADRADTMSSSTIPYAPGGAYANGSYEAYGDYGGGAYSGGAYVEGVY
ncbi:phenazine biosynthesis protein [Nocardia terpenica]|uniref:phenazine biosynthesis protein n=1 Tax=Nocardia terpenica TaxID=455432 RepID=UPI001581B57B|nr:phenazine biosynthesis protein [Nocardia terpenica]